MSIARTMAVDGRFDVGDTWTFAVTVEGTVTVTATVTDPAGSTTTPTVTESSPGVYEASKVLALAGRWLAVMSVTGDVVGVEAFTAQASAPVPESGMPDLPAVTEYLNTNGGTSQTPEAIGEALAAERAAQAAVCDIPTDYPADLAEALKRRVARNLAARAVPVAQVTTFEGGTSAVRVPRTDPEVTRLEWPYLKSRVVVA